jgi:DNA polymerase
MKLSIDIETYSPVNIKTEGGYKYAENSEILLFAYAYDNAPVKVIDCTMFDIPQSIIDDIQDPAIEKHAFNAAFERAVLQECLGISSPPDQWRCTMVRAAMCGLPLGLDDVAKVLKTTNQKNSDGDALIRYFSIPRKPTKANGFRTRNLPEHDPQKWKRFVEYNRQDVETEREIYQTLQYYNISSEEYKAWCLDQRINDVGVFVDRRLARKAMDMDMAFRARMLKLGNEISGLQNSNSGPQLKAWLSEQLDEEVKSLTKETIPVILKTLDNEVVEQLLNIRLELNKTSVSKYKKMIICACSDGRLRGVQQYYGANRTGRAAGRLLQVQNLPKGKFKDFSRPRNMVLAGNSEDLEMFYGAIPDTLSSLIRSGIIPQAGNKLLVSDFRAIEARVIAWLAGEDWKLDIFKTHGKIYEAAASSMFHIPIENITEDSYHRAAGKVAELAAGYQGGPNALRRMAKSLGIELPDEDYPKIVKAWRLANPNIVKYWRRVNSAAIECLRNNRRVDINYGMYFEYRNRTLFLTLPSGRKLSYYNAGLKEGKYGPAVYYWGMEKTWIKIDSYGGKFVENIVQAVARDCLYFALRNIDAAGYRIIMHVHDEAVCEEPIENGRTIDDLNEIMAILPPWAKGLPLAAAGFETLFYKK